MAPSTDYAVLDATFDSPAQQPERSLVEHPPGCFKGWRASGALLTNTISSIGKLALLT